MSELPIKESTTTTTTTLVSLVVFRQASIHLFAPDTFTPFNLVPPCLFLFPSRSLLSLQYVNASIGNIKLSH